MEWLESYTRLLVKFSPEPEKGLAGAGFCVSETHLLTCAHVVNTALKRSQIATEDCTNQQIWFSFTHPVDPAKGCKLQATVETWGPAGQPWHIRNDFAVLRIVSSDHGQNLKQHTSRIGLVSGDLMTHSFYSLCPDLDRPTESIEIKGAIGFYNPIDGKTTLTKTSLAAPFFKPGCSGSPIYSIELNGIAGIVSRRDIEEEDQARYANMVDMRRIHAVAGIPLRSQQQDTTTQNPLPTKSLAKYLCDRATVLEYMHEQRDQQKPNFYFLWGDENQEGTTFNKRYNYELSKEARPDESNAVDCFTFPLSENWNPATFKSNLLNRFREIMLRVVRDRNAFDEKKGVMGVHPLLDQLRHKVFIFKITNYATQHAPCYDWLSKDFLQFGETAYPRDLHILLLFSFDASVTEPEKMRDAIVQHFPGTIPQHLDNINRADIREWLEFIEPEDESLLKKHLRSAFTADKSYGMLEVLTKYDEVIQQLPPDHQF